VLVSIHTYRHGYTCRFKICQPLSYLSSERE